jgi:signal transduction histidine kinase/ActR/RegA family two-component response regulator
MSAASEPLTEAPRAPSLAEREVAARAQLVFERSEASLWFSGLGALMAVALLWQAVPHDRLLSWLAIKGVIFSARLGVWWRRRHPRGWSDAEWLQVFSWAVSVDGLTWGLLGTWLVPEHDEAVTAMLIATLVAVVSIGTMVLSLHLPALYGFAGSILLPVGGWHALRGDQFSWYIGIGLLLFALFIHLEARATHRHLSEMLRLRVLLEDEARARSQALALAERHSAVKSQFLATMSHEMRTPLHGILGLTRQLRHGGGTPVSSDGVVTLIERSGEHLLQLINDALDFAKIEAGRMRLEEEPFDLIAVLEEVVALNGAAAREKGLTLEVDIDGLGPPGGWMRGDAARVRQVLHNLLGNAIKFTEEGRVRLEAAREPDSGRVVIEVEDSGVGIPAEQAERIFDAFHQAEGSFARRYTGTGLGLTIARELARAMGGDLSTRAAPQGGSVFRFEAPLAPASPDTLPPEITLPPRRLPRLAGRVLVAEDNAVNALLVQAILGQTGVEVDLVENGAQAVERWERAAPDLVLMDCQMPVLDGFAATRTIRAREALSGRARVPIVALTANAFESDRERCLAAGMDEHLTKPFRNEELESVLSRYLQPAEPGTA